MGRSTRQRTARLLTAATALVMLAAAVIPAASVLAAEPKDMVLVWNQNAVDALSNPGTATPPGLGETPPVASIHLAMVQGAVYDAVNAIDRGHEAYLHGLPSARRTASKAAATAAAAHDVLVGLKPTPPIPQNVLDSLDALYATSLAAIPDGRAKTRGIRIGQAVAAAMLAKRADDGRFVPYTMTSGTNPGQWRPELPLFVSDPFAWVSNVKPFTMRRPWSFRTSGPDALDSADYATDYNEVKAKGAATGSTRTQDETDTAMFFAANPLIMMNRAFREISTARGLSPAREARLFAMTSMASADSLIGCWDSKDHYYYWRPITAIREAADDDNPATEPQTGWLPLLATPPYPDEPSGYNCYSAAMMHAAKAFFGTDRVSFALTHPVSGVTRSYTRFTRVLTDTINARVWLGIHFRSADVSGARLGRRVANHLAEHFFERVD